jgi:hypothetical protein
MDKRNRGQKTACASIEIYGYALKASINHLTAWKKSANTHSRSCRLLQSSWQKAAYAKFGLMETLKQGASAPIIKAWLQA